MLHCPRGSCDGPDGVFGIHSLAHDKLVDAFLPAGLLPKSNLVQ